MSVRAFITGVAGQDGSYLAEELLADGREVHGLVSPGQLAPGQEHAVPDGVVTHIGDLTDTDAMAQLLTEVAPDQVYNLAGLSSVAASWEQPVATARVNAVAALGLMEAATNLASSSGRRIAFVQASSAEIFGEPTDAPQTEETPIRPVNPYGAAKAFAHQAAGIYRSRGLAASSLILYNHESPRRPETFVTRKITATVAAIARSLGMQSTGPQGSRTQGSRTQGGADVLRLGNLDARRDWGWAPDYAHAMRLAADHHEADDYVIATGTAHTVREFVAAAFAHVGIDDHEHLVTVDPRFFRPVDATELRGDASRARERLGWAPSVSFGELVAAMVDADLR